MSWPTGSVPTTNLDAGADSPAQARGDLLNAVQKLNTMTAGRGVANGVASLGSDGKVPLGQLPVLPLGQGFKQWQVAGSYTWTVPAGVTRLRVTLAGGGGGGGYNAGAQHGGGGGAGGCARKVFTVTPGDTVNVVVGAGGAGASGPTNGDGANGGSTTVSVGVVSIQADGGFGGGGATPVGGTGGVGAGGVDDPIWQGGVGGTGVTGVGGMGGSNLFGGSGPRTTGYGGGGGGYGGGGGVSASAGAPGAVEIEY